MVELLVCIQYTLVTPEGTGSIPGVSHKFRIARIRLGDICPKAELGISDRCRCRTGVVFGDICPNFGSYCNLGSHSHFTSSQVIS